MYTPMAIMPQIKPWDMAPGSALMKLIIGMVLPICSAARRRLNCSGKQRKRERPFFRCYFRRYTVKLAENYSALIAS